MLISNSSRLACVVVVLCWLLFPRDAARADEPPAAANDQPPWTILLQLGADSPDWDFDTPMFSATFAQDGQVRIVRQRLHPGRQDVIYENDHVSPELLQVIYDATAAAMKDRPIVRPATPRNEISHPSWIKLECGGALHGEIVHTYLQGFEYAPTAMRKLISLLNGFLNHRERAGQLFSLEVAKRVPSGDEIIREFSARRAALLQPAEWTVVVRVTRDKENATPPNYEGLFAANYSGDITADRKLLYGNQALPIEDLELLHAAAQAACKEAGRTGDAAEGWSVHIELLDRDGVVIGQHDETRLAELGVASPSSVRVLHWINDHLAKDQRLKLSPPTK